MAGTSDTKCNKCGKWQIKLNYCPYCGHRHKHETYGTIIESKTYTFSHADDCPSIWGEPCTCVQRIEIT
jgi:uncharacterized OB-fold protein